MIGTLHILSLMDSNENESSTTVLNNSFIFPNAKNTPYFLSLARNEKFAPQPQPTSASASRASA